MTQRLHFKEILKDMCLYGVVGSSSQLPNLLLLPFLTRFFSTKEYGTVDIVTVSSGFVMVAMTLCMPSAIIRFFYEKRTDERATMFSSLLFFCTSLSAVLCITLILLTPFFLRITVENPYFVLFFRLGWIIAAVTAPGDLVSALLRAERKIIQLGVMNLSQLLCQIVLSVLFVGFLRMGISGVLWASIVSELLALSLGIVFVRKWLRFSFSWHSCREAFAYSMPMVPAVFTGLINQSGTRFVILLYLTLSEVGIYGVGFLLAGGISFIVTAFQNAWNAYVMTLLKHESFNEINRKMLLFYIGGLIAIAFPFLAILRELCMLFLAPAYISVLPLMPWLLGGIILQGSGNITSIGTAISKRTIINSMAAWTGAAVNFIFSFFLIPLVGLKGAAIGFFCAQLVFTVLLMVNTYRVHSLRFEHRPLILLFLFYLIWSQIISWIDLNVDGFVLRYLAGMAGTVAVGMYLNIWTNLYSSLKSHLFG